MSAYMGDKIFSLDPYYLSIYTNTRHIHSLFHPTCQPPTPPNSYKYPHILLHFTHSSTLYSLTLESSSPSHSSLRPPAPLLGRRHLLLGIGHRLGTTPPSVTTWPRRLVLNHPLSHPRLDRAPSQAIDHPVTMATSPSSHSSSHTRATLSLSSSNQIITTLFPSPGSPSSSHTSMASRRTYHHLQATRLPQLVNDSSFHQLHHTHPSITLSRSQLNRVNSYSAMSLLSHLSFCLFLLLCPIPLELVSAEGPHPHLIYASSISTLLAYHTRHHQMVSHPSSRTRRAPRSCSGRTRHRGSKTTHLLGTTSSSTPSPRSISPPTFTSPHAYHIESTSMM